MAEDLRGAAAAFKAIKQQEQATPASAPQKTSADAAAAELDARLAKTKTPAPAAPAHNNTRPAQREQRKPATRSTKLGRFNVDMPQDLETRTQAAAQQHDVWHIEYLRSAIGAYSTKIAQKPEQTPRRRRTANVHPNRTYDLGTTAKQQLVAAAKRTNRSQSAAFITILKHALDDDFAPTFDD